MNSIKKIAIAGFCLTFAAFGSYVMHGSGYLEGRAEGIELGKVEGFKEGRVYQAKVMAVSTLAAAKEEMGKDKKPVTDFWQKRLVGSSAFFHSQYASPPLLNTFGVDEAFHYIYTEQGTFAFPVGDFTYDKILPLLPATPSGKDNKFYGGKPQRVPHAF